MIYKSLRFAMKMLVMTIAIVICVGCSKAASKTTSSQPPTPTTTSATTTSGVPSTTATIPPTTTATSLPPTTTRPLQTTGVATNQVTISNYTYLPGSIMVTAGTKVTWTNQDMEDHTVTADTNNSFDITIPAGSSFTITFSTPGNYPYHCSLHSGMFGTVIVY